MRTMKKSMMIALLALALCACGDQKGRTNSSLLQNDSIENLQRENDMLRQEQDELLSTLNEIEDGFREINEAQGRLTVARRGEGANAQERIRENMQYIQETMKQNAELIEKLKSQLKASGSKSKELQHTIENLMAQMDQKNAEINQLRHELEAKNIRIDELEQQTATLHEDVSSLQQQSQQQTQTISQQDRQLNAAWYVVGSKRELKDHNILRSGKVLQEGFDASYFTEIDIRNVSRINLHSKSVKVLTTHPNGSYTLERDASKVYTLVINDYRQFWSTSKYLVVQVK
ncbi:MAG: hypothetical protein IJ243_10940 [Prevotella sp.]|nr:hypothetical protein [Prevotella sp.]